VGQSIPDILEIVFAHLLLDTVVPFELVKIRLQDKASAGKYNGLMDVVMKTVRNEGVLAMYQGLESTMWRHILWNAGYFGCIFQVRQLLPKAETKKGQMANDILAGSVGGTGRFSCFGVAHGQSCMLTVELNASSWDDT